MTRPFAGALKAALVLGLAILGVTALRLAIQTG